MRKIGPALAGMDSCGVQRPRESALAQLARQVPSGLTIHCPARESPVWLSCLARHGEPFRVGLLTCNAERKGHVRGGRLVYCQPSGFSYEWQLEELVFPMN